jgi:hypothetical protein
MNHPYTCHNCSTVFDLWPDDLKEQFSMTNQPEPELVQVKCPGCYDAGFTAVEQMIYTVNMKTGQRYQ